MVKHSGVSVRSIESRQPLRYSTKALTGGEYSVKHIYKISTLLIISSCSYFTRRPSHLLSRLITYSHYGLRFIKLLEITNVITVVIKLAIIYEWLQFITLTRLQGMEFTTRCNTVSPITVRPYISFVKLLR